MQHQLLYSVRHFILMTVPLTKFAKIVKFTFISWLNPECPSDCSRRQAPTCVNKTMTGIIKQLDNIYCADMQKPPQCETPCWRYGEWQNVRTSYIFRNFLSIIESVFLRSVHKRVVAARMYVMLSVWLEIVHDRICTAILSSYPKKRSSDTVICIHAHEPGHTLKIHR